MGIFIHLSVSHSVTRKEWESVYEETLKLIEHFPLTERRKVEIQGIDTICLVKTKEHEEKYGWNNEKVRVGWWTDGDSDSMKTAEEYFLPRDIVGEDEVDLDAGDALLGAIPAYTSLSWDDDRFKHNYEIWGPKTQGEPYHIYLLAVAALIEARLKEKAFTYGDITRGQLKKAIEIANQYLDEPIDLPDRCYVDKLLSRIAKLPLVDSEKLLVLERFYLGTQDASFGDSMRKYFSEDTIKEYWKARFDGRQIGTNGFNDLFNEYMLWGFDLGDMCDYVEFKDKEGNPQYEDYVKRVMDAKLHLKEKNCKDALKIDQEESHPYSIWTLMAQFAFAGAKNKKVDRFIPVDEIREALIKKIGDRCDVNAIIDEYLEDEASQNKIDLSGGNTSEEDLEKAISQDPADAFNQIMDNKLQSMNERDEEFDINDMENLKFYEPGDTIRPELLKAVASSRKFLDSLLDEDTYKELVEDDAEDRCRWLIKNNKYLLIRDVHWDRIFTKIKNKPDSFGQYYPLFRVQLSSDGLIDMTIAFMINDDFYSYASRMAENISEDEDKND